MPPIQNPINKNGRPGALFLNYTHVNKSIRSFNTLVYLPKCKISIIRILKRLPGGKWCLGRKREELRVHLFYCSVSEKKLPCHYRCYEILHKYQDKVSYHLWICMYLCNCPMCLYCQVLWLSAIVYTQNRISERRYSQSSSTIAECLAHFHQSHPYSRHCIQKSQISKWVQRVSSCQWSYCYPQWQPLRMIVSKPSVSFFDQFDIPAIKRLLSCNNFIERFNIYLTFSPDLSWNDCIVPSAFFRYLLLTLSCLHPKYCFIMMISWN